MGLPGPSCLVIGTLTSGSSRPLSRPVSLSYKGKHRIPLVEIRERVDPNLSSLTTGGKVHCARGLRSSKRGPHQVRLERLRLGTSSLIPGRAGHRVLDRRVTLRDPSKFGTTGWNLEFSLRLLPRPRNTRRSTKTTRDRLVT